MNKPRATKLVTILLAMLACGLLALAIYQGIAVATTAHEVSEQRQTLANLRRSLKDSTTVNGEFDQLAPTLGPRMRVCTWNEQLPYMMNQLSALATKRNITLASVQPEPMTTAKSIRRFPMRVSFQTDLPRLTRMLQDVKATTPLLKIERLSIRNNTENVDTLQLEMTIASFVILDKHAPPTVQRVMPKVNSAKENPKAVVITSAAKQTPPPSVTRPTRNAPQVPSAPAQTTAKPTSTPPPAQPAGWLRPPPTSSDASGGSARPSPAGNRQPPKTESPAAVPNDETKPAPDEAAEEEPSPSDDDAGEEE